MKNRLLYCFVLFILLGLSACTSQAEDPGENTSMEQVTEDTLEPDTDQDNSNGDHDLDNSDDASEYDALSGKRLHETVIVDESGKTVVTNPDDILVVANKERNLPADYVPDDLVIPDVPFPFEEDVPKKTMRKEAAEALEQLFRKAEADGLELFAQSGYRSYERQEAIFAYNAAQRGEEEANKVSAHPGQSEHQTGLSMDVTSPDVQYELVEAFADTEEGKWLEAHAHEFGFIIRYPKGKEEITGYSYEPWHLRYVGIEHAKELKENDIVLEEYLQAKRDDQKEGDISGQNE